MKSLLRAFFAVAATLGLSACLDVKSSVTVNKDGTGTIEETVSFGAEVKQMLGALGGGGQAPAGQPNPAQMLSVIMPDKAKAEARAKALGEGVTVKSHEQIETPDGNTGVKVTYAFTDVRKVKYTPVSDEGMGGVKPEPMTFALEGDTLTIKNPSDDEAGNKLEVPEIPAEMKELLPILAPLYKGTRINVQVNAAGGIASSDATHQEGDSVTYLDIQVEKFVDKPDIFAKFIVAAEKKLSNAKAAELFKGVDGMKIEPKEVVTVKLK